MTACKQGEWLKRLRDLTIRKVIKNEEIDGNI